MLEVKVGASSCGLAAGADDILDHLDEKYSKNLDIDITGCIGLCFLEPIVDIYKDNKLYRHVNVKIKDLDKIIKAPSKGETLIESKYQEIINKQKRIVTENYGEINPEKIKDYIDLDGYKASRSCLENLTPKEIISQIKKSGLRGRGGAGFPTWFKWNAALKSNGNNKYIVCNADEGDPGAFMDRSVLEGDPHKLIEGMIIAGYAMEATKGIVYVRAEYPLAIKRLQKAIDDAYENNFLGKNIFGINGMDFDLRIKAGAGAFVCGEETALIASLEGKRGMPRLKPPFPAQKGYFDEPTNINNVETLANVPWIFNNGADKFASLGTKDSKGTKLFALTGKIKHGGLVEVPMGMTLKEVIYDLGGGIKEDKEIKGVQMGGPSGGCIPKDLLDTPIDYESIQNTGAIVGSGGMVVMDESNCMVNMSKFFLEFTCDESCGKCTYCRIGTKRMLEILDRITKGQGSLEDIDLLQELARKIKEGSLCGLGQTAPNPVLTTLKYFEDEYLKHINEDKCEAGICKDLFKYTIALDKCVGCTLCAKNCPTEAIVGDKTEVHRIKQKDCIKCGNCLDECNFDAIFIR
ncbi:MAG: NADH-quinone oxidoreductase subunit NuoF [Bacillota bacterium]